MKIKEITVTYGTKINRGNYNSIHIETSLTGLLDDGDDYLEAHAELMNAAKLAVGNEYLRVVKKNPNMTVDEAIAGIPVDVLATLK